MLLLFLLLLLSRYCCCHVIVVVVVLVVVVVNNYDVCVKQNWSNKRSIINNHDNDNVVDRDDPS